MKTLLIFPPSTVYENDPTVPTKVLPLGLAYIASYLEKHEYEVKILDCAASIKKRRVGRKIIYGLSDKEIINFIEKYQPDLVGISSMYTAYAGDAHWMAKLVKKYNKKTYVVLGGAYASIFPKIVLKDTNIDLVVVGEGEKTFLEIADKLKKGKGIWNVKGCVIRKKNRIIRNPKREYIKNLDELPYPAYHLLKMNYYLKFQDSTFSLRKPSALMITSRGCPGHCVYCSIHSVWGHSWRGRSPINIVEEMELLINKYGIKEFYFMDDNMGVSKIRLKNLCQEIIKRKLDIRWTVPNGIAHWTLDKKILDLMKNSGCYRITFGIESGCLKIRKYIGKLHSLNQAKSIISYCNKIGMWTICTFIIGFPQETKKQIEETIKFAISCNTDLAVFYLLCPHPGTPVYEFFRKRNLLNFDYIFQSKKYNFQKIGLALAGQGIKTINFSEKELRIIVAQAYRKFFRARIISFLNPSRILNKVRSLEDFIYVLKISLRGIKILTKSISFKNFSSQKLRN